MPVPTSEQIDEAARRQFESDWMSGRPGPIETYLKGSADEQRMATLEELIQIDMEFRWRQWSSSSLEETATYADQSTVQPAEGPPLVETYLDQFPHLSESHVLPRLVEAEIELRRATGLPVVREDYRRRFPGQTLPERWFTARAAEEFPQEWGPYTLTAPLGKGAMGVVYRAHQSAAHREVALKRILSEKFADADPTLADEVVARFETEAKAAAQLTHENIVPVYDVGQVDGQPYFAMRLVEGKSLADLVRESTLSPRQAAETMKQVAKGLEHAHGQGVLHRDVKPANILLETDSGKALITDFGLAKWEQTDHTVTRTGQLVGTPAYMPPEQARDPKQAGPRADVYAIGATLYHLLTGRPPFQASGMVELMRQLLHEEPLAPRKLNPEVPQDLETICLHCLHKEPGRRYQTAGEVADELQRFLDHRPILTRPISKLERTVRWCRRNPMKAFLSITAVVMTLATFFSLGLANHIYRTKNAQLADSNELGTSLIDEWFTDVSENVLLGLPSMQPVRDELLTKARDYHLAFARLRGNDPDAQADVAVAELRLGQIASIVGKPDDGLEQYEKALTLIAALPKQDAGGKRIRIAEGDAWNATGTAHAYKKEFAAADKSFAQAEQIRQALLDDFPDETEIARKLFNAWMNRGNIALKTGKIRQAESLMQVAQQKRIDWLKRDDDELLRRDYAMGQYNLATIAYQTGQHEQAGRLATDAMKRFSRLIELNPLDVVLRWQHVYCQALMGEVWLDSNDLESAQREFLAVIPDVEEIIRENPTVSDYKREGAEILITTGLSVVRLGATQEAESCRANAHQWISGLPHDDPRVRYIRALNHHLIGAIHLAQEQGGSALSAIQRSLDTVADLATEFPEEPQYQMKRDELIPLVETLEQLLDASPPETRR